MLLELDEVGRVGTAAELGSMGGCGSGPGEGVPAGTGVDAMTRTSAGEGAWAAWPTAMASSVITR